MLMSLAGYEVFAGGMHDLLPYQNPKLPVNERVNDLISRMTMAEKISQLGSRTPAIGRFGIAEYNYWNEALHGVVDTGKTTSFPQAIALSSTWNRDLIFEVANAISDEARVVGRLHGKGLTYWCPVINMSRDPRWGRAEETYGEDPYLTGEIATSFIRGMQGNDSRYLKTVATVKHFACNNVDVNRHSISSDVDERSLMEYYLPAFKKCVTRSGVYSVMNTYNAVNGVPGPVNRRLLTNILRNEWGFDGFVVSDCDAVNDVFSGHHYVQTAPEATALSMHSGTDLNCGYTYQYYMNSVLESGLLAPEEIDTALSRVLKSRFLLGEFDPPGMVPYSSIPDSALDSQQHRDLALTAAREAIVLLKNRDAILPLNRDSLTRIAVIGPNADWVQLGGYSGTPAVWVPPLHGIIKRFAGPGKRVDYSLGCSLYGPADSTLMSEAETAAKNADVAVVVCGTDLQWAVEEKDRVTLDLPGVQDTLIKRVLAANPRTVIVIVSGFPFSLNQLADSVPGIIMAWYDGQAQGLAIADVLFGDYNPGGKLTSTWYKSVSDLPPMDHYDIKENRTYQYFSGTPLYPFGYGLSYTTFQYSHLVTSSPSMNPADSVKVTATVKNSGKVAGDEVVQLYIRHTGSSFTRPLKELKGFQKVSLQPGDSSVVTFWLGYGELAFYDEGSKSFAVDSDTIELMIASSSEDVRLVGHLKVKGSTVSPSYRLNPFNRIEAEDFERKSIPMEIISGNDGGQSVKVMSGVDFLEFRNVDFGAGAVNFEANMQLDTSMTKQGILELHLDTPDGPLAGMLALKSNSQYPGYQISSCQVNGVAGVRNLYVVFKNSAGGFCRMDWFRFSKTLSVPLNEACRANLYPNPASTVFWLSFDCGEALEIPVEIYNMQGSKVWSGRGKPAASGADRFSVNLPDTGLSEGVYVVRTNTMNFQRSFKLVVVKE
jgi:beta-glucosidase